MATITKFDVKAVTDKLDVKAVTAEASRVFYAGVGANALAVATVRDVVSDVAGKATARITGAQKDIETRVADVQTNVKSIDLAPQKLRDQATTMVSSRVDAITKDAKARREAIEARVAELQDEAKTYPGKVQGLLSDNVDFVAEQYAALAERGELVVNRLRKQQAATIEKGAAEVKDRAATEKRSAAASEGASTVKESVKEAPAKAAPGKPTKSVKAKPAAKRAPAKPAAKKAPAKPAAKASNAPGAKLPKSTAKPAAKKAPAKKAPSAKAATNAPAEAGLAPKGAAKAPAQASEVKDATASKA